MSVRWLSIGRSIRRILEQWSGIQKFVTELQKDAKLVPKCAAFNRIVNVMKQDDAHIHMHFINAMCTMFEKCLTLFQTEAPLVHVLYDQLVELLTALLVRFMKADVVTAAAKDSPEKLANIDVENVNSQLSSDDLSIGETTRIELRKLKSDAQRKAILGMRAFFYNCHKIFANSITSE